MRSNLAMALLGFGIIFLSFGAVVFVLELFGARYGTSHAKAGILMLGCLVAGAILAGGAFVLNRSHGKPTSRSAE